MVILSLLNVYSIIKFKGYSEGKKVNTVGKCLKNVVKLPEHFALFEKNGFDDMPVVEMLSMAQIAILCVDKWGHDKGNGRNW